MTDDREPRSTVDGTDGTAPEDPAPDGGCLGGVEARTASATDVGGSTVPRSAARQVLDVAVREYRLAVRTRWVVGLAALFALFSTSLVLLGGSAVGPRRVAAVVATMTQLGTYLVPLAALAVGYDAVVGAAERGSLEMLLASPLSGTQVLLGKYFGRAVALAGATLVGLAVGGALLLRFGGPAALGPYARFALATVGGELAFLSLSVLASTLAGEKTHALGGALLAWVWFVLLHDLAALGLVAALSLPEAAVSAMVLTNPADVFRVLVLRGLPTGVGGLADLLVGAGLSTGTLVVALVAWVVLPLGLAARTTRHRSI